LLQKGDALANVHLRATMWRSDQEGEKIISLADAGQYWDGYTRVVNCITFLNVAGLQFPHMLPSITQRLSSWIQKIKGAIDKIAKGVGANGYSIGVSIPYGASVSISFPV